MKKLFKILFIFSILFLNSNVFASNLSINTDIKQIKKGEVFNAVINLDTDGESINTIEGDLFYNQNILKIEKISIGNSLINFWVEKPDIKIPGDVHFSGITPGGVVIDKGEVFSIIFRGKIEGNTNLTLKNVNLFINDGIGTLANTKVLNANIQVNGGDGVLQEVVVKDSIMPEKFNFSRIKDSSIYDDKYFIAFNTGDKQSGIDHYQVCEYWSCVEAESPYLLKYQNNFYHIVVRAYDGNGNIRESKMTSPYLILLILAVFLVCALFYRRYLNLNRL